MIRTLLLAAASAAALAVLAFVVFVDRRKDPGAASDAGLANEDALFYRSSALASEDARRRAVLARLNRVTSAAPNELGGLKDEIALLAGHEDVIRLVTDECRWRFSVSDYEASAFMEIMSRIRHPSFVPFAAQGCRHRDRAVRGNAVEAAIVQRSPELVPVLGEILKEEPIYLRTKAIMGLELIGTPAALAALVPCATDPEAEVARAAIVVLGRTRAAEAAPALRKAGASEDPAVRVDAAWALVRIGDRSGGRLLAEAALKGPDATRALAARYAADERVLAAAAALRSGVEKAAPPLRSAFLSALVRLGDRPALDRLLGALEREPGLPAEQAAFTLARSGSPEALTAVRAAAKSGTDGMRVAVIDGLAECGNAEALPVLEDLAIHGQAALARRSLRCFYNFGDKGLEALARIWARNPEDDTVRQQIVGAVASQKTLLARKTLETWLPSMKGEMRVLAEQGIRSIDLEFLKRGEER